MSDLSPSHSGSHDASPISLMIADDHALTLAAMVALCERLDPIEVVATCRTGAECLLYIEEYAPQVALINFLFDDLDGVTVVTCVREHDLPTRLILLDSDSNPDHLAQGLAAGTAGYLLTNSTHEELSLAIRMIAHGDVYITSLMQRHLLLNNGKELESPPRLSGLQRRLLRMLVDGKTSKEIGNELHIEWRQVDRLRLQLMKQCDVPNVAALVRYAIEHHLVLLKKQPALHSAGTTEGSTPRSPVSRSKRAAR